MAESVRKISGKQVKAIAAMLAGENQDAVASAAGVSTRTITRWLNDADFRAALAEAETAAITEAARIMAGGATKAVRTLLAILDDDDAKLSIKRQAAVDFLRILPETRIAAVIEQRVTELEQNI